MKLLAMKCNNIYFIYLINIPYGQSSAKLPVTWSLGHLVTWSLGHSVTWSLGHSVIWSSVSTLLRTDGRTTLGSPGLLRRQQHQQQSLKNE